LDGFSFEDCALDAHDEEAPEAELIVSDVKMQTHDLKMSFSQRFKTVQIAMILGSVKGQGNQGG